MAPDLTVPAIHGYDEIWQPVSNADHILHRVLRYNANPHVLRIGRGRHILNGREIPAPHEVKGVPAANSRAEAGRVTIPNAIVSSRGRKVKVHCIVTAEGNNQMEEDQTDNPWPGTPEAVRYATLRRCPQGSS